MRWIFLKTSACFSKGYSQYWTKISYVPELCSVYLGLGSSVSPWRNLKQSQGCSDDQFQWLSRDHSSNLSILAPEIVRVLQLCSHYPSLFAHLYYEFKKQVGKTKSATLTTCHVGYMCQENFNLASQTHLYPHYDTSQPYQNTPIILAITYGI